MPDTISLGASDTVPQDTGINLPSVGGVDVPPSAELASRRAAKTAFAGVTDRTGDQLKDAYLSGAEALIRQEAAARVDYEKTRAQQKAVEDLISRKGGAASRDDILKIVDPFNPANAPADPSDVIEKAYSKQYSTSFGAAKSFMQENLLDDAASKGVRVGAVMELTGDLLTRNQYIRTRMENTENIIKQQSAAGYALDVASTMLQPVNEYQQRGLVPGVGFLDGLLGSNLDAQHFKYYSMPYADFRKTFDAAMDYLEAHNPTRAVQYAQAILAQSSWEGTVNNLFTAAMPVDYAVVGKMAVKGPSAAVRAAQTAKAGSDLLEAASKESSFSPARMLQGMGDLSEAAIADLTKGMNPIEKAETSLLSPWWTMSRKFEANPGTYLGREALTRANDFVDEGTRLFNELGTMNRVERTPEAVTNPENIREQKEFLRSKYRGPSNTILDIEGPIREPVSNTNWYKMKLGYYDGNQLADAETAASHAKNLDIGDPVIHGTAPDKVYIPRSLLFKKDAETGAEIPNRVSIATTEGGLRVSVFQPELKLSKSGKPVAYSDTKFEELHVVPKLAPEEGYVAVNAKTGKIDTTPFKGGTFIQQQGLGFHIEHWVPYNETTDLARGQMIKTQDDKLVPNAVSTNSATGAESLKNSVLGWVRNSDDTLSYNESAQRKAATYAQANLHRWAQALTRDLEDIKNGRIRYDENGVEIPAWKVWAKNYLGGKLKASEISNQFTQALNESRRLERWFDGPGELQDFYQRSFKRDPSFLETKAYFNFVKLVEADRMMMELSEFRYRARLGGEQVSLSMLGPNGEILRSKFFDGIPQTSFPNTTDEFILVLGKNKGEEVLHELGHIDSKRVKEMNEKILNGQAKAYMIYDRSHMPLSDFAEVAQDKLIRFVYSESGFETKSLDFNHVTRRAGGHFEWDYDHYLKIADVRPQYATGANNRISGLKNFYVGDITLMPVKNRAMGENIAKIWNEIHNLVNEKKWDEAKPLIAKLGIDNQQFTSWYASQEGKAPKIDPLQKVYVVPRNKSILSLSNDLVEKYRFQSKSDPTKFTETLVDSTKRGPENNFKVAYNQERNSTFDMHTLNDVGTQNNPVYQYQPATMVDPLETMNRALSRMVSSTLMDDYKIYHVEHWLREAEPHLNATPNEIRANPFGWWNKPEWRAGTPKHIVDNFMSNKMKAEQFIGTPNKFDTFIHSVTTELADSFYAKLGPEEQRSGIGKVGTIVPIWALHHVTDPISFMRSVTFNFKLGLGAIPQFIVQAQTHALIWALEPRHGTVGTFGTLLHAWASFTDNPAILRYLDQQATKMNMFGSKWRTGEWLEARKELAKTGFEHVAGEYANLNNQLKTRLVLNDFEKGLKIGQYPFRLGEQSTRLSAWYTAFREFREANPTKPITNIERSQILQKADLLTVNMSRASSSMLNHGAFSLSTQFLTYQIKLAELFWGKRLGATLTDRNLARARVLTFFSLMYGVPNAIGVTGAPFAENLREHFMDDLGYVPGEKWLSTMVNEGLPAWSMAMITGKLPNFGDRFGSQGFQNIKQGLNGSIPWWQAVGGASVTVFSNLIKSGLDPYYQYALSMARGDGPDKRFVIKGDDLAEPLKEISSFSTGTKWWSAIQTGLWINKNEQAVTDVSKWQATLYAITGMSPQEQDDMFIRNKMLSGEKDAKKLALKDFIKDWRRGMEARSNNDPDQSDSFFRNAMSRARTVGMTTNEILTAIAISGNTGNQVDSSQYKLLTDGDANKLDNRREYYRRLLQMKDKQ